jgi:hypothetical protein
MRLGVMPKKKKTRHNTGMPSPPPLGEAVSALAGPLARDLLKAAIIGAAAGLVQSGAVRRFATDLRRQAHGLLLDRRG